MIPKRTRVLPVAVQPGSYAAVPAWSSRDQWLEAVEHLATSRRADTAETIRAVARALARWAEHRTGRDVAVSVDRLARQVGRSRRTVQRRLADLASVGLVVTVAEGRHLTRDERDDVRRAGRRFITRASVRALSVPANMTPQPSPKGFGSALTSPSLTKRATRRTARTTKPKSTADRAPRSLAAQRTAAAVARRVPSVAREGSQHIGRLVAVVERFGLAGQSADDVLNLAVRDGWQWLTDGVRDPFAYFVARLSWARREGRETAYERARAESAARAARAAQRAAEQRADEMRRADAEAGSGRAAALAAVAALRSRVGLSAEVRTRRLSSPVSAPVFP